LLAAFERPHLPAGSAQLPRDLETLRNTTAALEREATSYGQGVTGTVRVSASEVIGVEVLPPALAELRSRHPGLKIELVPTNRVQDLLQREADIAVRMTPPRQELLIARPASDGPPGNAKPLPCVPTATWRRSR
jgi:DNA-binding transcriptional LysR family regulator